MQRIRMEPTTVRFFSPCTRTATKQMINTARRGSIHITHDWLLVYQRATLLSVCSSAGAFSAETRTLDNVRPGLIEGECVENILHNGRCCADVMAQMRRSVLTIPLGSPRSPFSISPQC